MKNNQKNKTNKNCGNKNCGGKDCGKKEDNHSYQHGGNND